MVTEREDTVFLGVRLRSGLFHAEIEVPLGLSKEEREDAFISWVELLEAAMRVGDAKRRAFRRQEPFK